MPFTYELTFANVPFVGNEARVFRMAFDRPEQEAEVGTVPSKHQPLADLIDEVNRLIDMRLIQDFELPNDWDRSSNSLARNWPASSWPNATLQVGEWYYPTGASRWSVFRGLATTRMVKAMLEATGGRTAKPFVMECVPITPGAAAAGSYRIETNLYLLPPRPLAEHGGGFDGLYLVTLVDDRYYFQYDPATLNFQTAATWDSLITSLASALNITITFSAIDAAYGSPEKDSQLWSQQGDAPALLDAVAANLGRTLVREFDGTYTLLTPQESHVRATNNRGTGLNVVRMAGGEIFNSGFPASMLGRNAVVPATINVVFPQYVIGNDPVPHFVNKRYQGSRPTSWFEDGFGGAYTSPIGITSGTCYSGSPLSGLIGVSQQTVWTTAKALYSGEADLGGNPLNGSGLTALALRIAQDVYDNQCLAALDEVYPGTFAWQPEGLHDLVWTWSERKRQASCRVLKTEWNQSVASMQHAIAPLSGLSTSPGGLGGTSVAQSWKDSISLSGLAIAALRLPLASGDYQISTTSVSYFPTQNRFKALVGGQEKVLAEGTSGKTYFNLVQRGIDGTVQRHHDAGSQVQPIFPDVTYGANLVTFEKNQFVFPQEITSGGIQGVRVVPQTQTVITVEASGRTINGVLHYSGKVQTIRTVTDGLSVGSQYLNEEPVWVRDRNGATVPFNQRLGGMFIGHGPQFTTSGKVDPVYVVDAPVTQGFWGRLTSLVGGDCQSLYNFQTVGFDGCGTVNNGPQGQAYEAGNNNTLPVGDNCGFVAWIRFDTSTGTYRFYEAEELFPVKLTALIGASYTFVEQLATGGGGFIPRPGGRRGLAVELNLRTDVPLDTFVWLKKIQRTDGTCDDFRFQYEVNSGGGTTTITNIYNFTNNTFINIFNGSPNTIYFVCDGVYPCDGSDPVCKLYIWVCQQEICGWYDICECVWLPQCYWCVVGECVTSHESPDDNASGPYLTLALCEEDCGDAPWWCVESTVTCNDCPDCPDGWPDTWILEVPTPQDPLLQNLGGSWTMNYLGSCLWGTGTDATPPRWVVGVGGNGEWVMSYVVEGNGAAGSVQLAPGVEFDCCGVNLFYDWQNTGDGPWTAGSPIVLSPATACATCADRGGEDGEQQITCVTAATAPEGTVNGPHANQTDCQSNCASTDVYWCVQTTTGGNESPCTACCNSVAFPDAPGAPESWSLSVPMPNDPAYDGFVGTHTLEHIGGCAWSTSGSGFPQWTIGLGFSGWTINGALENGTTVSGMIVGVDSWNCCGANTFDNVGSTTVGGVVQAVWGTSNPIVATPIGDCVDCDADGGEEDVTLECVLAPADEAPDGTISGPHDTLEECSEECSSEDDPYWCVNESCVRSATEPQGSTGVQYTTQAQCEEECEGELLLWWCVDNVCVRSATEPPGAVGGSHATEEDCEASCAVPVSCAASDCCGGGLIPDTLIGVISNKTGSASCLPNEVVFEKGVSNNWTVPDPVTGCTLPSSWSLNCDAGVTNSILFSATNIASSKPPDGIPSCNPVDIEYLGLDSAGVAGGVPGTFDLTIIAEGVCE